MINLFDLGMFDGKTTEMLVSEVYGRDFRLYGFEASNRWYSHCVNIFKDDPRITCFNNAISDKEEKIKLYKCPSNSMGNSIYSDKFNVTEEHEIVSSILFSKWFNDNIKEGCINIVKINIEGAEYQFFNDIISTGVYKKIDLICGTNDDIKKIKRFEGKIDEYYSFLSKHGIIVHYYSDLQAHKNIDLKSVLNDLLKG